MILFLFSFIVAFWFNRSLVNFPHYIHRQTYDDYTYLVKPEINFQQFCELSRLKPKITHYGYLLYFLCPLVSLLFEQPIVVVVLWILCFLSILDSYYLLTDIRYVGLIFVLSLIYLLIERVEFYDYLFNLLAIIIFFIAFYFVSSIVCKKEMIGNGDLFLLFSLCLFFKLEQMLILIFMACLFGILFYFIYLWLKKEKINKLPFIPFISLSSFIMFFVI
ncbi:hypothetical protein B0187_01910 [Haemophilus paracuniculus]|uniref:Prepilin type IV endopeptidase peptidase domain-containing protein n=1 Tax=Haemophilus paracuniculus TaxID=734 RepID=A0A1T0AUJ3_9PAST|nr:prepilin peptidase [Haemophilus paracuniculus]OOS00266.1 hypothetical protein B0187_01910 [Haemophilus paracuniculus]